jgi:hypothetical protein
VTRAAVVAVSLLAALLAPAGAQSAQSLSLGFLDSAYLTPDGDTWLRRSADSAADIVRVDGGWPAPDTPVRPRGFEARDPADPAYDFARVDAGIRAASARRLRILLSVGGAPRWAEGPDRDPAARAGTWLPDPHALEEYGVALARRYSGTFADPLRPGLTLPRVEAFQLWNEPNLSTYLTPQWRGGRPVAPAHYRSMLNAFYRGVKSVRPDALIVTAGTAPFGDPMAGGDRMMPARFVRELLCLRPDLRRTRCGAPAHFDVLAHHPYSVGSPHHHARNGDDVSIPDLGKLTRLLRAAERNGGALPPRHHRLWVTEVGYDSRGPDPDGVPLALHARFLEESLYLLWRQGVDTITWFQIRDQPPDPSYAATNQSGVYFLDGQAKPAQRAFRFPFVVEPASGRLQRVWGRAPAGGTLRIELRTTAGWRVVRTLPVSRHATFIARMRRTPGATLRGRVGSDTSLTWRAR